MQALTQSPRDIYEDLEENQGGNISPRQASSQIQLCGGGRACLNSLCKADALFCGPPPIHSFGRHWGRVLQAAIVYKCGADSAPILSVIQTKRTAKMAAAHARNGLPEIEIGLRAIVRCA